MSERRSSIFSFETLRLQGRRPVGFFRAILLALMLVVVSEFIASWVVGLGGPYAKYWDLEPGIRLEAYRQQVKHAPYEVVIVGDSTALVDIDPLEIERHLPEEMNVYNLACGGSYPLAFRCTNYPLLKEPYAAPKLVIVSFNPTGFTNRFLNQHFEQEIIDSSYCQCSSANIFDFRCLKLTLALPTLYHIKNIDHINAETQRELKRRGFRPFFGVKNAPQVFSSDREPLSGQQTEATNINQDRLDIINELATLSNDRRFKLLFLLPPQADKNAGAKLRTELERLKRSYGFMVVDFTNPPFILKQHYYDTAHLNINGAKIYSIEIGKIVASLLLKAHSSDKASRYTR